MNHSKESVDDNLTFRSSPESETSGLVDDEFSKPVSGTFSFSEYLDEEAAFNFEVEIFEFDFKDPSPFDDEQQSSHNEFIPDDSTAKSTFNIEPETEGQNSVSCSEDPLSLELQQQLKNETNDPPTPPTREELEKKALFEESTETLNRWVPEQASYDAATPDRFTAKSTSRFGSYANKPSYQTAASIPTSVLSMVSSNGPRSSYQPKVHTAVNCVDPLSLSTSSSPSANQGLYYDPLADVQNSWPYDEELHRQFDLKYSQGQEQVRIKQQHESYPEQVGSEQQRVEQLKSSNQLEKWLQKAEKEAATERAVKQKNNEKSILFLQQFGQGANAAYLDDFGEEMKFNDQSFGLPAYSTNQGYRQPTHSANPWLEEPYPTNQGFRQKYPVKQEYRQSAYQANERYGIPTYEANLPELEAEPEQKIEPAEQSGRAEASKALKASKKLDNAKNKRPANIANFVPSEHYEPLPKAPQSWGTINPDTRRPTFEYNAKGELTPTLKFTIPMMKEYLAHPFDKSLTLWVQICPADSGNRYSHQETSKCRFKNCSVKNNTILKGDYRVTLDEHASKPLRSDPFHNAGYVHLFCLEKHFDFPQLCKDFNVRPDTRVFPAEAANKMAITRDYPEMAQLVRDFIANSQSWGEQKWDYSKTLSYALTAQSIKREPATRQATREKRGGNSVDKHFNNLDIKAENAVRMRSKDGLSLIVFEKPVVQIRKNSKRKSCHDEDDSETASAGSPAKKSKREPVAKLTSPAKKRQTTRRQSTKRKSSDEEAYKPSWSGPAPQKHEKPLSSKRKSSEEEGSEGSLFGSPKKKSKFTKPAKSSLSAKKIRKQPARKSSSESSASAANSSTYDANGSASESSFTSSSPKALKRKRGIEQNEKESSVESFQRVSEKLSTGPMVRYGLHKKQKREDTAGLETALGDMQHFGY